MKEIASATVEMPAYANAGLSDAQEISAYHGAEVAYDKGRPSYYVADDAGYIGNTADLGAEAIMLFLTDKFANIRIEDADDQASLLL